MKNLATLGRWLFFLSFSFYVFLHLALPEVGVRDYVPKYLPLPFFWNYLTGVCLLAFMISCVAGKWDRLASLLLAVYLLLVILMIHAPNAGSNPMEMLNVFRIANMIGGALMYAGAFSKDSRLFFNKHIS
jgi:uncharacterized membrane protein YphA (DoxX/SURF4 family)